MLPTGPHPDIIALMSLEPGQRLGHYEIVEPIGKGEMGEVFRAKDGTLGRDVAIKVRGATERWFLSWQRKGRKGTASSRPTAVGSLTLRTIKCMCSPIRQQELCGRFRPRAAVCRGGEETERNCSTAPTTAVSWRLR